MGEIVELVRPTVSNDTVALLRTLLKLAEEGHVTGIAAIWFVASGYQHGLAGRALRSPTFTRGALLRLDDVLEKLVDG